MGKVLTTNLKKFAFMTSIITITFFILLTLCLRYEIYFAIAFLTIFYAISMTYNGYYFGKNDPDRDSTIDLGFLYHLTTFIIVDVVGFIWVIYFDVTEFSTYIIGFVVWTIGIFIHKSMVRSSVKGVPKDKMFP